MADQALFGVAPLHEIQREIIDDKNGYIDENSLFQRVVVFSSGLLFQHNCRCRRHQQDQHIPPALVGLCEQKKRRGQKGRKGSCYENKQHSGEPVSAFLVQVCKDAAHADQRQVSGGGCPPLVVHGTAVIHCLAREQKSLEQIQEHFRLGEEL